MSTPKLKFVGAKLNWPSNCLNKVGVLYTIFVFYVEQGLSPNPYPRAEKRRELENHEFDVETLYIK